MPIYRIYVVGKGGRIERPPELVDCADDEAVIREAKQHLDGHAIEVWELARHIVRLEPGDHRRSMPAIKGPAEAGADCPAGRRRHGGKGSPSSPPRAAPETVSGDAKL
jgi:hypothetical protein